MTYKDYCKEWEMYYRQLAIDEPNDSYTNNMLARAMADEQEKKSPSRAFYYTFVESCNKHRYKETTCIRCTAWRVINRHRLGY